MAAQELFLDERPVFEKRAGMLTRLGDNVDLWAQEIAQEALRRHPFLGDFELMPMIDKLDEQQGYAFGSIVVRPRTERTVEEMAVRPMKEAHIPMIVRDQLLQPIDVFVDGRRFYRLTEARLRGALFDGDTFDAARRPPPSASLYNDLMPPLDRNYGFGFGSKTASSQLLLPQLSGRVRGEHVERLKLALSDPRLMSRLAEAPEGVKAAFVSACRLEPSDAQKTAATLWSQVRPTVVQMRKQANGDVALQYANAGAYQPQEQQLTPDQAAELLGDQGLVSQLEADGSVTVSANATAKSTLDAEEVKAVDQFGLWQAQDSTGNKLVGFAFPQLLSLDLKPMPLTLFTNGSQYALQEHVAGKLIGKSTDVPRGAPRGYGALYYVDHGTARAFVPLSISGSYQGPDGLVHYSAQTDLAEGVEFTFAEGLKTIVQVSPTEYIVPSSFKWLPLKAQVDLVPEPALFQKAAMKGWAQVVELTGDGQVFSLRGAPVEKLAHADRSFLDRDRAAFLAGALGVDRLLFKEALRRASDGQAVVFGGCRPIVPASEKVAEARRAVATECAALNGALRNVDLIKEASFLDDAQTVDKVLGLGFINAENVATFVDMLPVLEEVTSRLAEMLVASRLGMKDVPEQAIERSMTALDDVITGLRSLEQKETAGLS